MNTYSRGTRNSTAGNHASRQGNQNDRNPTQEQAPEENQIRVDGYEQIVAMLKIADKEFRESLLKRLAQRDRELARSLRAEMQRDGIL